ncbi:peptidyl-prolyl cis-trans isomerase A (cyclophilin A) [Nitrosomonas sp. Nm84]|uniref:peptidylprolyl isomerase n=1 Tax=Nitrosomonas sp. Nm84 TaxID=200124 RepID=UPI000D75FF82|nr:peptidylprolyl isomerase [Nitrosomonas sp. Nm84]PXW82424.1 peptidyl-prolyl cis-trans isomerase A (cyclophilin A) [Nitrosomonas sp. Nm84]
MYFIQKYYKTALFACLLLSASIAKANPVACFSTNMGQFCIELLETQTPLTTANFLSYINSGAYTNGIFHRSMPGFVIQGGGYKLVDGSNGKTLAPVTTFPPVINEFKISNTRGTVAMAKLPDNPDSATSQWFVNLADNSLNLDNQNSGFTVFGRVIFGGMTVFDAIAALPPTSLNLGGGPTPVPLTNYNGAQVLISNFVQINQIAVTDATGVFSEGVVSFAVDIGTGEALEVSLRLIEDSPNYIFELDQATITTLPTKPANVATFSSQSSELRIPSVMIDASTVVHNVFMKLTNPQSFQFTLISFD